MRLSSHPFQPQQCPSLGAGFQAQLSWHYPAWHLEELTLHFAPSLPFTPSNENIANSPQSEIKPQGNRKGILPIKGDLQREASFIGGWKWLPPRVLADMALSMGIGEAADFYLDLDFSTFFQEVDVWKLVVKVFFSLIRNTFFLLLFRIKPLNFSLFSVS